MKRSTEQYEVLSHKVLALAIKSEIEAVTAYSKLSDRVKNALLKKKLKFLISEEKKHRKILENLFSQKYPKQEIELPEKSFLPPIKVQVDPEPSIMEIFKAALQAEKLSEEFYKEKSQKIQSGESRKLLEYLSRVERSHYFMIKSEIDLLEKFPEYYDVEEFHFSHEMVHLGP